jgi:hypothetical protein
MMGDRAYHDTLCAAQVALLHRDDTTTGAEWPPLG